MGYNAYDTTDPLDRAKLVEGQAVTYISNEGTVVHGKIIYDKQGRKFARFSPGGMVGIGYLDGRFYNRRRDIQ